MLSVGPASSWVLHCGDDREIAMQMFEICDWPLAFCFALWVKVGFILNIQV
jgi:hypothetical protein